jgi:hypothetical protein
MRDEGVSRDMTAASESAWKREGVVASKEISLRATAGIFGESPNSTA